MLKMGNYIHKFKTRDEARKKQQQMKRMYGYTPKILVFEPRFNIMGTGIKKEYVVVEPKDLERIDR